MLCLGASVGSRYGTSVRCQPGNDLADSQQPHRCPLGADHESSPHAAQTRVSLAFNHSLWKELKLKAGTNVYHQGFACPSKTSTLLGNSSATRKGITKRHRRCETVQHPEAIKGH